MEIGVRPGFPRTHVYLKEHGASDTRLFCGTVAKYTVTRTHVMCNINDRPSDLITEIVDHEEEIPGMVAPI